VFNESLLERISQTLLEVSPAQRDEALYLENCLKKLSPQSSELIRFRYYESLGSREIAKKVGATEVAIRVTLLRIREQLRKCIENQYQNERRHP
jgi:RNA polymerase sigma factor (sigma-70 family)